jgi:VanZ family protein
MIARGDLAAPILLKPRQRPSADNFQFVAIILEMIRKVLPARELLNCGVAWPINAPSNELNSDLVQKEPRELKSSIGNVWMNLTVTNAIRATAWLLAFVVVALSVVPPAMRPVTRVTHFFEHFGIFLATGLAFGLAYQSRRFFLTLSLVISAAAIELIQRLIPGRHARLSDFIVDSFGLCIGVGAAALLDKFLISRQAGN